MYIPSSFPVPFFLRQEQAKVSPEQYHNNIKIKLQLDDFLALEIFILFLKVTKEKPVRSY